MAQYSTVPKTVPDIVQDQIARLKAIFPECVTESAAGGGITGGVDFNRLRATLGDAGALAGETAYTFTWAGKAEAFRAIQTPSGASLAPAPGESVNWDATEHLFIEGENLEVLKLLYKSYFGRIKMIYIDPPYNTGNDFIYQDDYSQPRRAYLEKTGQMDAEGNLLRTNTEASGRFHSDWLSMMYPRLFLARQLLREDGVIFVSIGDNEVHNLRLLMNEIFGPENFIAQLVWEKGRKNDAKLFSVGHEYVLAYARSVDRLRELKTVWREPKPGAQELWDKYCQLRESFGENDEAIEKALQEWYSQLPKDHPSKALSRYKHIDQYGPWRDRDISWPGGGGPRYDVIHPVTGQPCKVPPRGWGFANPEAMQRQIDLGLVEFREDHTDPPFRKAHLRPVPDELDEEPSEVDDIEDEEEENLEIGLQVMGSVIYKQSQVAVKHLRKLMGGKVFDNPKDHEVLARLIRYVTDGESDEIILDFFAGSCATAEAVLTLNHEPNTRRRFIMVQIPEPTPDKSPARAAGYATIAEVSKERIRRVIAGMQREDESRQLPLGLQPDEDGPHSAGLGFKVFKLAPSTFRQWEPPDGESAEALGKQLALFDRGLEPGADPRHVIYEVLLKLGYSLNARIEPLELSSNQVYRVTDAGDDPATFTICLDDALHDATLDALPLDKETTFVCLDTALDDSQKVNLSMQCLLKVI